MHPHRVLFAAGMICGIVLACDSHAAAPEGVVDWWRFESVDSVPIRERHLEAAADEDDVDLRRSYYVHDELSDATDDVVGFHESVPGAKGNALRLGGFGAHLVRKGAAAPQFANGFSIEAWVALGAYPVNWCPIVGQAEKDRGFLFGVDAHGHLGVQAFVDGEWETLASAERIGLNEWAHVACTYNSVHRLEIFLNGQRVGELQLPSAIEFAPGQDLLVGKHPTKHRPEGTIRPWGTKPVHTYFDGIVDELKIYDRPVDAGQFAATFQSEQPKEPPQLPARQLPAGPTGKSRFGAFYTTLKYYDSWDAQWRVGDDADVVVSFDDNPCRFVFWRGTSYVPHWVTENGIWYTNEFNETSGKRGCQEPMSDKQCRFSHVRIIENSDARVVVHWRYALVGNWYEFAHVDELTGWGDWSDETYTIYPDGVGVRKVVLHSSNPNEHEWHEGILVMGAGKRPDDVLNVDAVIAVNEDGQSRAFSWMNGPPKSRREPRDANIQIINTKSTYKPVLAFQQESSPNFQIYDAEVRDEVSRFPWWNHWPAAFDACDGRYAMDADRASHSAITHVYWNAYDQTDDSMTKIMLNGISKDDPEQLARLTRSWDRPPALSVDGGGFESNGYDATQRAYVLQRGNAGDGDSLKVKIDASQESPVAKLCLVVNKWSLPSAAITVDGKPVEARIASRPNFEGSDLVVWLPIDSDQPVSIAVAPQR